MKNHPRRFVLVAAMAAWLFPVSQPCGWAEPVAAPSASASAVPASALATPVIRAGAKAGEFEITSASPGAGIRYSLDGSDPGPKGGPYLAPIVLPASGGVTIRARAYSADRKEKSELAEMKVPASGGAAVPATLVPCTQDRDWPVYDWAKRHAAVSAIVKERKPAVIFVGDSITHMFGGEPHDRGQPGKAVWEARYEKLGVANLGFGYDFVENTLWRLQHGEMEGGSAKAVVVMIGTNNMGRNTPEEIAAGVKAICATIHEKQPKAQIILLGIFPRGPKPDALRAKIEMTNKLLATTAEVKFLDFGAKFLEADGTIAKETMGDYLHPTAKGYEIWANEMEGVLQEALKAGR